MASRRFQSSISVVLPAFNEEECIAKQVTDTLDFLPTCFAEFEVIVVDDGSRDRTAEIVRDLARAAPRLQLISHPANRGYGRALATGFAAARSDVVFYTDSDGQFDIREIKDAVPLLRGPDGEPGAVADAVFGFRVYRYDSVLRCLLSWVYNRLVRVLFWVKVRDVDCAFKLFTRQVADKLVIDCNDFFVDTEMVAKIRKLGFKTVEKGVRHYPRMAGRTTVRMSHIPRTLWTVAKMFFRIHFPGRRSPGPASAGRTERA